FALAQAAPGPNMLVVTLIGWNAGGLAGALVSTVAVSTPSSLLTYAAGHLWHRFRQARWRNAVQRGLVPVTAGLVMASAALLIRTTATGFGTGAVIVAATVLFV